MRYVLLPRPVRGLRRGSEIATADHQARFLEGLADGNTALLQQVHHTITDGVGGLKLSFAVIDREAEPPPVAEVQEIVGEVDARERDEHRLDPVADGPADAGVGVENRAHRGHARQVVVDDEVAVDDVVPQCRPGAGGLDALLT